MNAHWPITLTHCLAVAWQTLGQHERALAVWDRLIADHGHTMTWTRSRAHLRAQQGRVAEALEDYQWLCAQSTASAGDWFNQGFLHDQLKAHRQAVEAFEQALARDPQLDRAWYGMGVCLLQLGQLEQAQQALQRNTELQPMSPHGWVQLARLHGQRQEPEKVRHIIAHLRGFEPKVAAQLMREHGLTPDAGRA